MGIGFGYGYRTHTHTQYPNTLLFIGYSNEIFFVIYQKSYFTEQNSILSSKHEDFNISISKLLCLIKNYSIRSLEMTRFELRIDLMFNSYTV